MKGCANCYWADKCKYVGKRCECYEPIFGAENNCLRSYKLNLIERSEEYAEIVKEQQGIEE